MNSFSYVAKNGSGEMRRGRRRATSRAEALAALRHEGLTPLSVTKVRLQLRQQRKVLTGKQLAVFCNQFGRLLSAGVPIADALELLAQSKSSLAPLYGALLDSIRKGSSLSDAFHQVRRSPSASVLAIINAGEHTGTLPEQLNHIARASLKSAKVQSDILGQLIYPIVLVGLMISTIIFLAFFILPQFETIFDQSGAPIPFETRLVLMSGMLVREYISISPVIVLGMMLLSRLIWTRYRRHIDRFLINVPKFGRLVRYSETSRIYRNLSTLLMGGCDMARALDITAPGVMNLELRTRYALATSSVRLGVSLHKALEGEKFAHSEAVTLIRIGERSGSLAQMLDEAARVEEEALSRALRTLTAILSPLLTVVIGLMTAGVIASVMLGVMSLNETSFQ